MINSKKLEHYYHKHGVKKAAEHFKVTPKTIYTYLRKYKIETVKEKKDRLWYNTVNALNLKWSKQKYRNWWGCGD